MNVRRIQDVVCTQEGIKVWLLDDREEGRDGDDSV